MNTIQRRQFEMLLRIEDFGKNHKHLFAAAGAQQAFAAITAAIQQLTATTLARSSASVSARADRKGQARKTLRTWLKRVVHLAAVLRNRGRALPRFELPASCSDQSLLETARQFAKDAATAAADFSSLGMGPDAIAATAAAFETALRDRGMSQADRTAATARIQDLLASALLDVRTLDVMVQNELAHDNVVQAVWKQARRVDWRPGRTGAGDTPPATAPAAPVTTASDPPSTTQAA